MMTRLESFTLLIVTGQAIKRRANATPIVFLDRSACSVGIKGFAFVYGKRGSEISSLWQHSCYSVCAETMKVASAHLKLDGKQRRRELGGGEVCTLSSPISVNQRPLLIVAGSVCSAAVSHISPPRRTTMEWINEQCHQSRRQKETKGKKCCISPKTSFKGQKSNIQRNTT